MPIGKYIYCTSESQSPRKGGGVTNAYRQVHLLYRGQSIISPQGDVTNAYRQVHLLYCAVQGYPCTVWCHKCLSASTFTVPVPRGDKVVLKKSVTNAYRQVHLLYLETKNGVT